MSGQLDCYKVAPGGRSPEQVACALVEKAFCQGYRVHLQLADDTTAATLDELLWTFRADSFVPHQLLPSTAGADNPATDEKAADTPPVTLGAGPPPSPDAERSLLLLLGTASATGSEAFQRIAAVMAEDDEVAAHAVAPLLEQARAHGAKVREHRL